MPPSNNPKKRSDTNEDGRSVRRSGRPKKSRDFLYEEKEVEPGVLELRLNEGCGMNQPDSLKLSKEEREKLEMDRRGKELCKKYLRPIGWNFRSSLKNGYVLRAPGVKVHQEIANVNMFPDPPYQNLCRQYQRDGETMDLILARASRTPEGGHANAPTGTAPAAESTQEEVEESPVLSQRNNVASRPSAVSEAANIANETRPERHIVARTESGKSEEPTAALTNANANQEPVPDREENRSETIDLTLDAPVPVKEEEEEVEANAEEPYNVISNAETHYPVPALEVSRSDAIDLTGEPRPSGLNLSERVGQIEIQAGILSDETIKLYNRIQLLEEEFGITSPASTFKDRVAALETVLG